MRVSDSGKNGLAAAEKTFGIEKLFHRKHFEEIISKPKKKIKQKLISNVNILCCKSDER